jgi:hypothetical protein
LKKKVVWRLWPRLRSMRAPAPSYCIVTRYDPIGKSCSPFSTLPSPATGSLTNPLCRRFLIRSPSRVVDTVCQVWNFWLRASEYILLFKPPLPFACGCEAVPCDSLFPIFVGCSRQYFSTSDLQIQKLQSSYRIDPMLGLCAPDTRLTQHVSTNITLSNTRQICGWVKLNTQSMTTSFMAQSSKLMPYCCPCSTAPRAGPFLYLILNMPVINGCDTVQAQPITSTEKSTVRSFPLFMFLKVLSLLDGLIS